MKQSIRIIVEKISFQGLSEDVDGDGWLTKLRGKSVPRREQQWFCVEVCDLKETRKKTAQLFIRE